MSFGTTRQLTKWNSMNFDYGNKIKLLKGDNVHHYLD